MHKAQCAAELPLPSANPKADQFVDEFRHWLRRIGGDTAAIDVKPCAKNPEAGLAVYTSEQGLKQRLEQSWWKRILSWMTPSTDFVIATVPLNKAVTVKTVIQDEKLGRLYEELLNTGVVNERQLLMLFILIERIRGTESEWYPWINILPQAFNTPVHYGRAELAELRGTTLYTATLVLKDQLREQWSKLNPLAQELLKAVGPSSQGFSPTFNDFLWAHSVFWSRSITFPDPQICPDDKSTATEPREGIIPGIDFCNHSPESVCRWSIWNNAASRKGGSPDSVSLVTSHKKLLKPGDEITINYGDKSNEELLHLYGFTIDNNPSDALMVVCPPPDSEPGEAEAKMALLLNLGLQPQLFLTAAELDDKNNRGNSGLCLSNSVWDTLEVLTMDAGKARTAATSLSDLTPAQAESFRLDTPGLDPLKAVSKKVAQLTSLQRLLHAKLAELEDSENAIPLEQDIAILEAKDTDLPPLLRSCIVYRASQKRIARGYLSRVEKELSQETSKMLNLHEKHKRGMSPGKSLKHLLVG